MSPNRPRTALVLLSVVSALAVGCATAENPEPETPTRVDSGSDTSASIDSGIDTGTAVVDSAVVDSADTAVTPDSTSDTAADDVGTDSATDSMADAADTGTCSADQCLIDGACVNAGTPKTDDPCRACLPTASTTTWSNDTANVTCGSTGVWGGLARTAGMATTPYGHKTALSCHNCYAGSFSATSSKITAAITDGADLIELDLRQHSDGVTYVMHDEVSPAAGTPTLAQVLAITALRNADRPLFIEFKETAPNDAFIRGVLDALVANGYGAANRPVFLRAFGTANNNLLIARRLLATSAYAALRPHVRLSALLQKGDGNTIATLRNLIRTTKNQGFHMVELEYQTRNLFGGLAYAKSLGLATGIYTIPVSLGEMFIANLRDDVDEITVDYPMVKARQVVSDNNGLVYFNTAEQSSTATTFTWRRSAATPTYSSPLNGTSAPIGVAGGIGDALFGTSLGFVSSQSRRVALYDADNAAAAGYFVATAVKFDSLSLAEGETKTIVGKADSAGFSLELYRAAGSSTILRFGVHVNGAYEYATYPAASLNTTDAFLITGAYDGDGAVRMMVNNSESGVTPSGTVTGGVTQNDSLVLIGADPQTTAAPRFFFDGKVQMVTLQKWTDH